MKKQPKIHCQTTYANCKELKRLLEPYDLSPVSDIYIMDVKQLVKEFINDEEVEYDFIEEGYLGKTRDRDYEHPQILVAADAIWNHFSNEIYIEKQVIITILHELAHIKGMQNEKKAEAWARKEFKKYW